jgi:hypothetical protein
MDGDENIMSFHSGSTKSSLGMSGDQKKQIANDLLQDRSNRQVKEERQLT